MGAYRQGCYFEGRCRLLIRQPYTSDQHIGFRTDTLVAALCHAGKW